MNPRAFILIVLGLLFGPGYYAFCEHWSGRPGEHYALTERGNRWPLPDGSILRLRGGLAYKPLPLELAPEQNDYRLRFSFNVTQSGAGTATNEYQLSLMQDDVTVAERTLKITGRGTVQAGVDPLRINYPGSYLLVLEEVGAPPLEVSGVSLQIDTGVEQPKMWVAWSGLVLLVFGIGMVLRDAFAQARRRR